MTPFEKACAAMVGKTIQSLDTGGGNDLGTSFLVHFTDGTSVEIESEGYEGVFVVDADWNK